MSDKNSGKKRVQLLNLLVGVEHGPRGKDNQQWNNKQKTDNRGEVSSRENCSGGFLIATCLLDAWEVSTVYADDNGGNNRTLIS